MESGTARTGNTTLESGTIAGEGKRFTEGQRRDLSSTPEVEEEFAGRHDCTTYCEHGCRTGWSCQCDDEQQDAGSAILQGQDGNFECFPRGVLQGARQSVGVRHPD